MTVNARELASYADLLAAYQPRPIRTEEKARATTELVKRLGGQVHALAFLIELVALNGRARLDEGAGGAKAGVNVDVHRHLRLTLSASYNREGPYLELIVADDGVGIISAVSATSGTGGGLLTHSALLAIAGGSLNIKSSPGEGVTVKIVLPAESLR